MHDLHTRKPAASIAPHSYMTLSAEKLIAQAEVAGITPFELLKRRTRLQNQLWWLENVQKPAGGAGDEQ